MPRNYIFQRLNKHPKHRWSMLRNMAASLFIHERITTTYGKARVLLPLVNKFFGKALGNNQHSVDKLKGLIRVRQANYKLFNDIRIRLATSSGSILKLTRLSERRKGDNSEMAMIELIKNPYIEKENEIFDQIHDSSELNFTNWELFIRSNELKSYINEKEKRDEIYRTLKKKFEDLKLIHKDSEKLIQNDLQEYLFGVNSYKLIKKLQQDLSIPQQHFFNMYMQAVKSEKELDKNYEAFNSYLIKLISQTKNQINLMNEVSKKRTRARNYEVRNFSKYYINFNEKKKEIEEQDNSLFVNRRYEILQTLALKRKETLEKNIETAQMIQRIENYCRIKNYNIEALTEVQIQEIEDLRHNIDNQKTLDRYFQQENEAIYLDIMKRAEIKKRAEWNNIQELKKKFIPKKVVKLYSPVPNGEIGIEYQNLISQSEMRNQNLDDLEKLVTEEEIKLMKSYKENLKNEEELQMNRSKYEVMLKRYHDPQVKKNRRTDLFKLNKSKIDLDRKEKIQY